MNTEPVELGGNNNAPRILFDGRWRGVHGIGRFAREVSRRAPCVPNEIEAKTKTPSLVDTLFVSRSIRGERTTYVSPGYSAGVVRKNVKQILTVHDVIHLLPQLGENSRRKRLYYNSIVKPAIVDAGVVMTVSEFSKREISDKFNLPPEVVVNVGNGISEAIFSCCAPEGNRAWPGRGLELLPRLRSPYIAYVGNGKPHKNIRLLIRSLLHLPTEVQLVAVTGDGDVFTRIAIESGVDLDRMTLLHGVSDTALGEIYRGAECVAIPSLYEGFGLSGVEAIATGTPVAYVCDAVAESVGAFGARCEDSTDSFEFAQCLLSACEKKYLVNERAQSEIIRRYSWDSVADRFWSTVYENAG